MIQKILPHTVKVLSESPLQFTGRTECGRCAHILYEQGIALLKISPYKTNDYTKAIEVTDGKVLESQYSFDANNITLNELFDILTINDVNSDPDFFIEEGYDSNLIMKSFSKKKKEIMRFRDHDGDYD